MYVDGGGLRELVVAPANPRYAQEVSACRFDTNHELLWAGDAVGHLHNLQFPSLQRYAGWRASLQRVLELAPVGELMLSLFQDQVCLHSLGGAPRSVFQFRENGDMACCHVGPPAPSSQLLVGHRGGQMSLLDLATGRTVSKVDMGGESLMVLRGPVAKGALAVGCAGGKLCLLDPRKSFKVDFSQSAHSGGLVAMDGKEDLMASCGYGMRMGMPVPENVVKVWDVRFNGVRPMTSLPFNLPSLLRFHPSFPSTLLVASSTGLFTVLEANNTAVAQAYQVDVAGDSLSSCDISPSGECIAFGGSGGYVHLWTSHNQQPRINLGSLPLEMPPRTPRFLVSLGAEDSFAAVPTWNCLDGRLLSDIDPAMPISVGMPPRVVDPSLLKDKKQVDFVAYIPNPCFSRGLSRGESRRKASKLRNTRLQMRSTKPDPAVLKAERARQRAAAGGMVLPMRYKHHEIRSAANVKFEEFDFSYYNPTPFAGLENDVPNAFVNPLLQVLFFLPAFQEAVLQHVTEPAVEFCLTCEISFLFRMLDTTLNTPCRASNLLRALCQIPEASALGLVLSPSKPDTPVAAKDVASHLQLRKRLTNISRFLLDQLHKEGTSARSCSPAGTLDVAGEVDRVFGLHFQQRLQALSGKSHDVIRELRTFQVEIQYPKDSAKDGKPTKDATKELSTASTARPTFVDLLQKALVNTTDARAYIEETHSYQAVRQSRTPLRLPTVLVVSCAPQEDGDLQFLQPPEHSDGSRRSTESWLPLSIVVEADPEARTTQVHRADQQAELSPSGSPTSPSSSSAVRAVYQLTAVVVHIMDADEQDEKPASQRSYEGHFVAHIKVPQPYWDKHSRGSDKPVEASASSSSLAASYSLPDTLDDVCGAASSPTAASLSNGNGGDAAGKAPSLSLSERSFSSSTLRSSGRQHEWLVFNDFCVSPCPTWEVTALFGGQKVPCLLYYTQVGEMSGAQQALAPPVPVLSPAAFAQLCCSPPLNAATQQSMRIPNSFRPLDMQTEAPGRGLLLGIDAEFVALMPVATAEPAAPSTPSTAGHARPQPPPQRLNLARVSVVRGEGPLALTPCIDDYVRTVEHVFDYLTRFSGLLPGDLDPSTSRYYLVTLKAAYLKLRYLVDAGCVFVGHGLKTDFRMMNIIVPPHQMRDTVELFHLPRQRKLSLRFLASYLLGLDIQSHTHDSVEDARTALKLYELYRSLEEQGTFHKKLLEIYDWGKVHGWDPVVWVNGKPQQAGQALTC